MYTLVIANKNYSSWSLRAWLTLRQSNLAFEEVRLPLYTREFEEKIGHYSPTGQVPLLVAGDLRIWDSLAICEYLAERHPELHLWPADARARATARSVSCEMHAGFAEIRTRLPMNIRRHRGIDAIDPGLREEIDRVLALWRSCRQAHRGDGNFLFGRFSIADAMYAPVVLRFSSYLIEAGGLEKDYMDTMLALPSLRQWIDDAVAEKEVIEGYED